MKSTTFTDEQYTRPFPPGVDAHYWHRARNRIIWRKLRPLLSASSRVLDIGCGPGIAVDFLRRRGIDCRGVDTGSPPNVVPGAASHLSLGADAFELPDRDSFDVLMMLDVLEHLPDPRAFIAHARERFPNARHLFVTVPARMELWSNYDEFYGHERRYTRDALRELDGPWRLVSSGYFFHALYVAARAAQLVSKTRSLDVHAPARRALHDAVGWLLDREEALAPSRLVGSSLWAVFSTTI
jgi:SAM-dependent methyltransferase